MKNVTYALIAVVGVVALAPYVYGLVARSFAEALVDDLEEFDFDEEGLL